MIRAKASRDPRDRSSTAYRRMSRREILRPIPFSSATAVILLTFVLLNSCTTSTDCKEGRRTSLLHRRSPYWTLTAEPHTQRNWGILRCEQEKPRPPAACNGALERGSWARSAERIRSQNGGEGIVGPRPIRLRGAGPDQGGSGESEGDGDDIEEFRKKFLEMFSNGGQAQGGGMGEGASYGGDDDGATPGGCIGGMAYIDEDGTLNITNAVQVFDYPIRLGCKTNREIFSSWRHNTTCTITSCFWPCQESVLEENDTISHNHRQL
jgi:hypothetical protein